MHLAFDIFQGIGIAAAVGIRPFLPGLAAGALAAGDVEIHFDHTSYSFLQSLPFLLVMVIGAALLVVLDRGAWGPRVHSGSGSLGGVLAIVSLALGALFFAGSLVRDHHGAWPGWVGGVICALVGIAAARPFLARLRSRLDDAAAAVGLPVIADGSALLICVLSIVAPPIGVIALLGLLWLLYRGQQRDEQKYAGLRILR
ncbi:MAG TPA: DUF4126 family protein [Solirubrobacteraceae bacterium]|nr:DUF4126 family protein [Solirubrobacteraceae bacterium]